MLTENKFASCLLHFPVPSGMVQLVARGPLEPKILVRVQVPEPPLCPVELISANAERTFHNVAPRLDFAETEPLD